MRRMINTRCCFFLLIIVSFFGCNGNSTQTDENTSAVAVEKDKVASAISCTINGLTPQDSTLYANGGGNDFKETIVNKNNYPGSTPEGMVWIPGGEFSM